MTEELITRDEVIEDLRAIVAQFAADKRYEELFPTLAGDCFYRHPDETLEFTGPPACLVGQVLDRHGLLDGAVEYAGWGDDQPASERFSDPANRLLAEAQSLQDRGQTWGEAVDGAIQRTARVVEA